MAALRKFKPPFLCYGTERYVINPYTSCSHGCIYCYGMRFWKGKKPEPKEQLVEQLSKEIPRKRKILPVEIATIVDPYIPKEGHTGITRKILELLIPKFPVILITRSDLVLRDIDVLSAGNCIVEITVTTPNPEIERRLEPGAPTFQRRIEAIRNLCKSKIPVAPRIDPIIPYINDSPGEIEEVVQTLSKVGADHVTSSTMKADSLILRKLSEVFPQQYKDIAALYKKEGKRIGFEYYLPEGLRIKLMRRVQEACSNYGITFACCREGFAFLESGTCDGLHLMESSLTSRFSRQAARLR